MAVAMHNIKVNGRWVRAGETYEPETTQMVMPVEQAKPEPEKPEAEKQETPKAAPRTKTTPRRKRK